MQFLVPLAFNCEIDDAPLLLDTYLESLNKDQVRATMFWPLIVKHAKNWNPTAIEGVLKRMAELNLPPLFDTFGM